MRVHRGGGEEYAGMETAHLLMHGQGSAWGHPWEWDDATAQELADELADTLSRRRPLGFAPWPATEPGVES